MNDPRSGRQDRMVDIWLDPELILSGIAGLIVIGLGARALARWTVGEWAAGGRVFPSFVLAGAGATMFGLLIVLRHRKRWLYLGGALAIIAVVTFVLVSADLTIPSSWLD